MPSQWVKEELKKDFLLSSVEKTIEYFKTNRDKAIAGGVIVFVVVVIAYLSAARFHKSNDLAYEQVGYTAIYLKSGDFDATIKLADQILSSHPGGVQGGYARFYKGEALYRKGNFEEAAKSYLAALPYLKKVQDMGAMILFDTGNSYESAGKYSEAIANYKKFAEEYPAHYLLAECQLGQARCLEAAGDIKAAAELYQNIASLNSTTMYKSVAEAKLRELQPRLNATVPTINMLQPVKAPAPKAAKPAAPASK